MDKRPRKEKRKPPNQELAQIVKMCFSKFLPVEFQRQRNTRDESDCLRAPFETGHSGKQKGSQGCQQTHVKGLTYSPPPS